MKTSAFILTVMMVFTAMICVAQPGSPGSSFNINGKVQNSSIASENSPGDTILYTNLIQSVLHIEYTTKLAGKIAINIYDAHGKPVISEYIESNTQLDLKSLPAGVYFIKINDGNGKELYSGKVIKQ
ncbi:MAG TPA: T9SS type A sorting domain-containing protein [Parafilimonas sp.]|nr:T9SS type A sorting domain-containing protein [Parafilimonas sp.]